MSIRVVVTAGSERGAALYAQALLACDGELELAAIHPGMAREEVQVLLGAASGLLLTGGPDVHPGQYRESPHGTEMAAVQPERDALERAALLHADENQLPVLAICRGMQMLNVHRGGGLLQDIGQSHRDGRAQEDKWMSWHGVDFLADTHLARLIPDELGLANSRHHQAVNPDRIGEGLQAVAWCAHDETIEGIEAIDGDRFVLGVQWHPENMALHCDESPERAQARAIFAAFAAAVRTFAAETAG